MLVPFGGGIDSVVTTSQLSPELDQTLFIVSPRRADSLPWRRPRPVTGLDIMRATRTLDPQILARRLVRFSRATCP